MIRQGILRRDGLLPAPGTLAQRLRIATGMILFAYVATHLANHALGLVSVEAMQAVRGVRLAFTRSVPGQLILIAAVLLHLTLGVSKFLERRTLRIAPLELLQLGFGLLIPLLLLRHILATRGVRELYGIGDGYLYALWVMWPAEAWQQAGLITLAWVHGCIGLFHWARLKPWFLGARPYAIAVAALWPALAYAGFVSGARMVQAETEWTDPFTDEQYASLLRYMDYALYGYLALLGLLVAVRLARAGLERAGKRIAITYAGVRTLYVPPGFTLLEASRLHGLPHAAICGGRARCSTCRVRVLKGQDQLPAVLPAERRVLDRIGAAANVRLACQLRPVADVEVAALLPAQRMAFPDDALYDKYYWGVEEKVTILFCDLRGFTALAEQRLPFDVVFLLNQYLGRMSEAIGDAGGYVDKFMGDGIMAIFGIGKPQAEGVRQAFAAVRAMGGVIESLNQSLKSDLPEPLNIGIGLDSGNVILGRVGSAERGSSARHITALGDPVNTASRLEAACRDQAVQLIVSARCLAAAGAGPDDFARQRLEIKGKTEPVSVLAFARALDLPVAWAS